MIIEDKNCVRRISEPNAFVGYERVKYSSKLQKKPIVSAISCISVCFYFYMYIATKKPKSQKLRVSLVYTDPKCCGWV